MDLVYNFFINYKENLITNRKHYYVNKPHDP